MHRAEQIMQAVETALMGLTTTGTNVKRARVYKLTDEDLPALSINMGADDIADENNMAFIDRSLAIEVVAHVKANDAIDTTLNKIRREVHQALYADYTLGQSFVIDTVLNGDDSPEFNGELEKPVASQRLNYIVMYRHSVADPGA
ncbi:MAG: hypothetical protein JKY48_15065 [Flavobacteriales bacterium]|nr:hypothetical protein [Flavobacteriales bacterium]